jgi:hypothetical protein
MNNKQNAEEERQKAQEMNTAIMYHLSLRIPSVAPGQTPTHPDTRDGNNHAYAEGAEDNTNHSNSSSLDTEIALYNLLVSYIELLENMKHGGWSLEEDNSVRAAIAALVRAGWTAPPLHDTWNDDLITHYGVALLARERKG